MLRIERTRLVEAPMNDMHDYSPAQLRRYLRRYHEIAELADGAHAIRYDRDERGRTDERDPMANAHIKRDLDAAIGWLQTMDQRAAELVDAHYVLLRECADLADQYELAQSSVHRIISASIREMAEYLGWRDQKPESIC